MSVLFSNFLNCLRREVAVSPAIQKCSSKSFSHFRLQSAFENRHKRAFRYPNLPRHSSHFYAQHLEQNRRYTKMSEYSEYPVDPEKETVETKPVPDSNVPRNIFITGANSGLGLEMVKQLLELQPENIFATYRNLSKSKELEDLSKTDPRIHLIQLDMRQDCRYNQVARKVHEITKNNGINLLINNAGIFTEKQSLCEVEKKTFLEFLEVNTVSPVLFIKEMLPLLTMASEKNQYAPMGIGRAAIVNITSSYGSISANDEGNYYLSRCCRAALNAASKTLSVDLKPKQILVTAISPGWVRTYQGGPNAPLSVQESISGVIRVLQGLDDSMTGMFFDYSGQVIPW